MQGPITHSKTLNRNIAFKWKRGETKFSVKMKAPEDKSWWFCLNTLYNSCWSWEGDMKMGISWRIHHKRHIGELNWKVKPQQSQTISCHHGGKWCKKCETKREPYCQTLIERLFPCCDVRREDERKGIWKIVPVECGTVAVRLTRCSESINTEFTYTLISGWVKLQTGGKKNTP